MTDCDDVLTAALDEVSSGWSCQRLDDGWLHVTTNHQYSDGDQVELLVKEDNGHIVVSDGGETTARLDLAGVNLEAGRTRDVWRRLVRAHQLDLSEGRLRQEGSFNEIGWLAENMANALSNLDAIRLMAPPRPNPKFNQLLVTLLEAEFQTVEEQPQITGRSGITYRPTASASGNREPVYIQAVAGSGTNARQRSVEHAFTMFSDINGSLPPERKLAVLSTSTDWRAEHLELLSEVAYVGSWDNRETLIRHIKTPFRSKGSRILMDYNQISFVNPSVDLEFRSPRELPRGREED